MVALPIDRRDAAKMKTMTRLGAALAIAASAMAAFAATNITENVTLTEDTDWTEFGTVTVAEGVTIDLNGHSLTVAGLAGVGRIVDGDEYRRVEYIEAKQTGASQSANGGDKTQCIDTGYRHNAKTEVDVRVAYTAPGNYQVVYGARNTSDNATQFGVWLNGSKFMDKTCQNSAGTSSYAVTANRIYDIHISKSGANTVTSPEDASINYDLANGNGTDGNNTSGNDFLLAMNQSNSSSTGSWPCKCKVWFCKIYDNGTLVRNFVPVVRKSDEVAGFYDTVNNQFYGNKNANAAALDAGPTISGGLHLVIFPDATYDLSNLEIDAECISEGGTLTGDIDWSGLPNLTIETGTTLDLAGHKLYVSSISGSGKITDSVGTTLFGYENTLSGYERIEYLQASGTQYIDTGYIHDNSTKVDMRIKFDNVSQQFQSFYGARNSKADTAKGFSLWLNYAKFRRAFGESAANIDSHTVTTSTIYDIHLDKSGACTATPEGGTAIALGSATQGGSLTFTDFLFAINQDTSAGGRSPQFLTRAKLYSCKIFSGTTLVRDFVPVRRTSDGVLGLLDLAHGNFYTNAGSGSFSAGETIVDVVGGELHVVVADGGTGFCNVALTGGLKVVKEGEGTLLMDKASQTYFGGTEIAAGVLKSGAGLAQPCGVAGGWIVADASGTVDFNGNANMQSYRYDFADGAKALNGGAAISSGAFTFTSFYTPVSTGAFTASLADGVTLDLTEWNGAWPISNVTAPAGTAELPTVVALKVDMGDAAFRNLAKSKDSETGENNGCLLTFGGARPANVSFVLDATSKNRCRLLEEENGDIVLAFLRGIGIIIR